jgi:DNA-binding transcriptional MerR regulator
MNSFLRSLSEAGINVHDIKRRMKKEQQQSEQLKQDSLSVVLDRIHSLRYSFEGIDDKYDGLTLRMLQEADEIKDRQSVQLSYYNRLAIVLYCLGLSLGLIGKLIGVNAGGGD